MDTNTALLGTGTGGTLLGLLVLLYKIINGKKCRTRCCGKDFDMAFETSEISPHNHQQINDNHQQTNDNHQQTNDNQHQTNDNHQQTNNNHHYNNQHNNNHQQQNYNHYKKHKKKNKQNDIPLNQRKITVVENAVPILQLPKNEEIIVVKD